MPRWRTLSVSSTCSACPGPMTGRRRLYEAFFLSLRDCGIQRTSAASRSTGSIEPRTRSVGLQGQPCSEGTVEIGYETRLAYRCRGYAGEAVAARTNWALASPRLPAFSPRLHRTALDRWVSSGPQDFIDAAPAASQSSSGSNGSCGLSEAPLRPSERILPLTRTNAMILRRYGAQPTKGGGVRIPIPIPDIRTLYPQGHGRESAVALIRGILTRRRLPQLSGSASPLREGVITLLARR